MRRRATSCAARKTRMSPHFGARRRRSARHCWKRAFRARSSTPTADLPTSTPSCSPTAGRNRSTPSRKTQQGIGLVWRLARRRRADVRAQAHERGGEIADRSLLASVSRRTRRRARCASRPLRRRVAPELPFDARGRRRAGRRSGTRTRRLRAGRPRRHDLRSGVHATRRRYAAATGLFRCAQRSVQRRGNRSQARPSGARTGTACSWRSSAHCTWTSARSCPMRDSFASKPTWRASRRRSRATCGAGHGASGAHDRTRADWSDHLTGLPGAANVRRQHRRTRPEARARRAGARRTIFLGGVHETHLQRALVCAGRVAASLSRRLRRLSRASDHAHRAVGCRRRHRRHGADHRHAAGKGTGPAGQRRQPHRRQRCRRATAPSRRLRRTATRSA